MGMLDGYGTSTLQFLADALRGLTPESGRNAVLNPDGTAMTIAQIAVAANLTTDQVTAFARNSSQG